MVQQAIHLYLKCQKISGKKLIAVYFSTMTPSTLGTSMVRRRVVSTNHMWRPTGRLLAVYIILPIWTTPCTLTITIMWILLPTMLWEARCPMSAKETRTPFTGKPQLDLIFSACFEILMFQWKKKIKWKKLVSGNETYSVYKVTTWFHCLVHARRVGWLMSIVFQSAYTLKMCGKSMDET